MGETWKAPFRCEAGGATLGVGSRPKKPRGVNTVSPELKQSDSASRTCQSRIGPSLLQETVLDASFATGAEYVLERLAEL
jgi:hypothetical protein